MQMADTVRKQSKKNIGVGWKLFALLLAFVLLMLGVIWFFQVRLLNHFYKQTKYKELEAISKVLSEYVGSDSLDEAAYSCAVDYATCIRIFRRNNQMAVEVASADVSMECFIHGVSQNTLNEYYRNALSLALFVVRDKGQRLVEVALILGWQTEFRKHPYQPLSYLVGGGYRHTDGNALAVIKSAHLLFRLHRVTEGVTEV